MSKLPVSVLAATGIVGQRFVQRLCDHPWFEIGSLAASASSVGKEYQEACSWKLDTPMPERIGKMTVRSLGHKLPGKLVFSALPADVALPTEGRLAQEGYIVCSNASAFRLEPDVPLIIPEINSGHLGLIWRQRRIRNWPGFIITSPNCTTTAVSLPLKPLSDAFGLEKVVAVSMQAASGAGYPGVSGVDLMGNVLPFIAGEEEKIEAETKILLGSIEDENQRPCSVAISAHANRVPVVDGHTVCLSIDLREQPFPEEVVEALRTFGLRSSLTSLPSAPPMPILVREGQDRPQPRMDRQANDGMSVVVGRVRSCPIMDIRMVSLVHNTIRGAAGGAILNAELLYREGFLS